jgi:LemA protein
MRTLRTLGTLALLVVGLAGCNQYDKLIEADSVCDQKWADLQAQLERRGDLVPNLVAKARASASQIQLSGEDLQDPEKVAAFQKAQEGLHGALSRLLVTNEQYPQLQANAQFHDLQVQLEGTENRILRAREEYNAAARTYNAEIGKIRGAVVKRATGSTFKPRVYFTASAEATAVPKVTF